MKIEKEMSVESSFVHTNKGNNNELIRDFWNAYMSNDMHEKIFRKKSKDIKKYPWKKKIVKISSKKTGLSIYRIWNGSPLDVKSKDILYVDNIAKYSLISTGDDKQVELTLSEGTLFKFYWNHFDNATRVAFKLGLVSVFLGVISLIIAVADSFVGQMFKTLICNCVS